MKIFFDGGCRPNPGKIEIAVVMAGQTTILRELGEGTNSDAEWLALIHALSIARSLGLADFVLVGDAADIIAKVKGAIRCRAAELRHLERFRALASPAHPPRLRFIKRSQNLAGIALAGLHAR